MVVELLYLLVPVIAFLYASVGFGGATGYLAVMSLFGISPQIMATTALALNILVAGISFTSFYQAGHLRRDLLLPFLVGSVPASFLGGYFRITDQLYFILLYLVLAIVSLRLLFLFSGKASSHPLRPVPLGPALFAGLGIGLLSGMVGIGGGIILSPLIILAGWGSPKQAATTAAAFIVLNSVSGLLGRSLGGSLFMDSFSLFLLPLAVVGALAGSYLGARRLSSPAICRILGVILLAAVANYWLNTWK